VGTLTAKVLTEGAHSGSASGVTASSFRVIRQLLDRVEDPVSGASRIAVLDPVVPDQRLQQARAAAEVLGDMVYRKLPFAGGTQPVSDDVVELLLNNTWRPTLSVTGAGGIPDLGQAGNTLRPHTSLKLSFRLPPTCDAAAAAAAVKETLESDPPYGAEVSFDVESAMGGWHAPEVAPWLEESMKAASTDFFGASAMYMGTGGSIPFMGMLGERFPGVQFLITGLLGPNSNAHGPNEFLHIDTGKKLTMCVARVLADHATRNQAIAA
jgi:acetylornithine deacetylase/succinyl-diaminopimelate desuccinylase-like protein